MSVAKVEKSIFTSPNGAAATRKAQQGSFDAPWWKRYFKWEHLTVAGREVKGLVVTPQMGLTIFLALGTVVGGMYYQTTGAIENQGREMREIRDMTIEMKSRLDERTNFQKEAESERKREQRDNEDIAKVWRETMNERMNRIDKRRQ